MQRVRRRLPVLFLALALGSAAWSVQLADEAPRTGPTPAGSTDASAPRTRVAEFEHREPSDVPRSIANAERRELGQDAGGPFGDWIEGTVVDRSGQPVAHAYVEWRKPDGDFDLSIETEADGRFSLVNLDDDEAAGSLVAFQAVHGRSAPVPLCNEAVLVLDRAIHELCGRARFPDGSPVRFAPLSVTLDEPDEVPEGFVAAESGITTTGADGSFEFLGLAPGSYRVVLDDDDESEVQARTDRLEPVELVATRPRVVLARVWDDPPWPVGYGERFGPTRHRLLVWNEPDEIAAAREALAARASIERALEFDAIDSDLDGAEQSIAVDCGDLVLCQRTPGILQHVWTIAPAVPTEVRLELPPPAYWRGNSSLSLRATADDSGALERMLTIEVESLELVSTFLTTVIPAPTSLPIPPGRYRLHVHQYCGRLDPQETRSFDFVVRAGEVTEVEVDFRRPAASK